MSLLSNFSKSDSLLGIFTFFFIDIFFKVIKSFLISINLTFFNFLDIRLAEASQYTHDIVSYFIELIFFLSAISSKVILSPHVEFFKDTLCEYLFLRPTFEVLEANLIISLLISS